MVPPHVVFCRLSVSSGSDRGPSGYGRGARFGFVLAALGLLAGLGTARGLEPDPGGYGTHRQLGLPPCAFLGLTGHRCPTCGMTTAFAWAVRGRIGASWQANPAGCLLAACSVVAAPWFVAGAW